MRFKLTQCRFASLACKQLHPLEALFNLVSIGIITFTSGKCWLLLLVILNGRFANFFGATQNQCNLHNFDQFCTNLIWVFRGNHIFN